MQPTIESALVDVHLGTALSMIACSILNLIVESSTGADLVVGMRELLERFPGYKYYFEHGFQERTMWVRQRARKGKENWLTVKF